MCGLENSRQKADLHFQSLPMMNEKTKRKREMILLVGMIESRSMDVFWFLFVCQRRGQEVLLMKSPKEGHR